MKHLKLAVVFSRSLSVYKSTSIFVSFLTSKKTQLKLEFKLQSSIIPSILYLQKKVPVSLLVMFISKASQHNLRAKKVRIENLQNVSKVQHSKHQNRDIANSKTLKIVYKTQRQPVLVQEAHNISTFIF